MRDKAPRTENDRRLPRAEPRVIECFTGELLEFSGPDGSEKEVAARFNELRAWFAPVNLAPEALRYGLMSRPVAKSEPKKPNIRGGSANASPCMPAR